ncbi:hypothetical protein [Marinicella meishanensis]|uniref:hypothetical protein n=1 Tax=Marinicella meishanensis TaxID=2873263 RepID=UPI001CC190B4|nr:hypothetical protein [Marinicella sp. NBU2979]
MNINLTVAKVEFGGNTCEGQYFYAFSPKTVLIKHNKTPINITFTKSTSDDFKMVALLSSDNHRTFNPPVFGTGNRSLQIETNSLERQLINVSVLVQDINNPEAIINCDPQVLNDPDPDI